MTVEAVDHGPISSRSAIASGPSPGWFKENRGSIIRHAVINFFMVIILLPLAWVLMMSIKSLPDAMRGDFWPRRFDFTHYSYVFERIATLPVNLWNSIYVTSSTVLIGSTPLCRTMVVAM